MERPKQLINIEINQKEEFFWWQSNQYSWWKGVKYLGRVMERLDYEWVDLGKARKLWGEFGRILKRYGAYLQVYSRIFY